MKLTCIKNHFRDLKRRRTKIGISLQNSLNDARRPFITSSEGHMRIESAKIGFESEIEHNLFDFSVQLKQKRIGRSESCPQNLRFPFSRKDAEPFQFEVKPPDANVLQKPRQFELFFGFHFSKKSERDMPFIRRNPSQLLSRIILFLDFRHATGRIIGRRNSYKNPTGNRLKIIVHSSIIKVP